MNPHCAIQLNLHSLLSSSFSFLITISVEIYHLINFCFSVFFFSFLVVFFIHFATVAFCLLGARRYEHRQEGGGENLPVGDSVSQHFWADIHRLGSWYNGAGSVLYREIPCVRVPGNSCGSEIPRVHIPGNSCGSWPMIQPVHTDPVLMLGVFTIAHQRACTVILPFTQSQLAQDPFVQSTQWNSHTYVHVLTLIKWHHHSEILLKCCYWMNIFTGL